MVFFCFSETFDLQFLALELAYRFYFSVKWNKLVDWWNLKDIKGLLTNFVASNRCEKVKKIAFNHFESRTQPIRRWIELNIEASRDLVYILEDISTKFATKCFPCECATLNVVSKLPNYLCLSLLSNNRFTMLCDIFTSIRAMHVRVHCTAYMYMLF